MLPPNRRALSHAQNAGRPPARSSTIERASRAGTQRAAPLINYEFCTQQDKFHVVTFQLHQTSISHEFCTRLIAPAPMSFIGDALVRSCALELI